MLARPNIRWWVDPVQKISVMILGRAVGTKITWCVQERLEFWNSLGHQKRGAVIRTFVIPLPSISQILSALKMGEIIQ